MDQVKRTWVLLGAFTLVLFAVSLVSQRLSPRELRDPRLSVHLSGPHGAAGLADAMQRFGVPVVEWTRPISRVPLEGVAAGDWLALLGLGGGGGQEAAKRKLIKTDASRHRSRCSFMLLNNAS